jgi:hypothetical protein
MERPRRTAVIVIDLAAAVVHRADELASIIQNSTSWCGHQSVAIRTSERADVDDSIPMMRRLMVCLVSSAILSGHLRLAQRPELQIGTRILLVSSGNLPWARQARR